MISQGPSIAGRKVRYSSWLPIVQRRGLVSWEISPEEMGLPSMTLMGMVAASCVRGRDQQDARLEWMKLAVAPESISAVVR